MSHTVIILLNCVISYFHFLNSIIVCAKQRHYVSEGGVDHFYNFCCQVKNAIVLSEEKKRNTFTFSLQTLFSSQPSVHTVYC